MIGATIPDECGAGCTSSADCTNPALRTCLVAVPHLEELCPRGGNVCGAIESSLGACPA